ncbi:MULTISPECIES: SDR family NAD(P)-dependent oxidoreductase [Streptomyces]|uniref:SDR family NAD(P)-dependent oxidoreductase n=1 Tax=Streptomyces plicatus TaxID=1922 RepID=A0ABW1Y6W6_STRPL|nr:MULTISPECIES: SDR family NAD(P)-dependent oxidoreductase [Streptomyces]KYK16658.1 oxidoreductase [Streptomyces sp. CC71]RSS71948.1 SDR family NAD(P)-dependent oxidoreductase [Streptomyces sp. WAC06128]GGZ72050.1 oxidoreductase [Streptomyces plicatus]
MNGDRAGGGRPLALITGASSGIGYELARLFAEHGHDLVVNAEDERLEHAARRLRETGVEVRAVRADLRTAEGVDRLVAALTGLTVDVAALNAGVGQGGAFVDTDPRDDQSVIDLNVSSTVRLAKPLLRDMVARGVGRLMFTSSVAATMPGSFQSVYNASKSFVQSFAQALQEEVADTGVTVTSFMPGPTETDFFRRAGMTDTKVGTMEKDDPAQVARQAYDAVMKGRGKLVTGSAKTKAQGVADKVLPDRVKAAVHRRMAEPGSATEDGAATGDGSATEDGGR